MNHAPLNIVVIEPNLKHQECIKSLLIKHYPHAKTFFITKVEDFIGLKKSPKNVNVLIANIGNDNHTLPLLSTITHPSRVILLTSKPSTLEEHQCLEMGFDHYFSKNKTNLDKLPLILKKVLRSKSRLSGADQNSFFQIKHNLRLLSHVINNPRLGIIMGQKQWHFMESEMESLIKKLKKIV